MGESVERVNLKWIIKGAEEAQKKIDLYYTYLNHHLDLYGKFITENNVEKQRFHKKRIKEIRGYLMELEYFNLGGSNNEAGKKNTSRTVKI